MRTLNYNQIVRVYLEVLTRNKMPIYTDEHGIYFVIYNEDYGKKLKYIPGSDGGLYSFVSDDWDGQIKE